MNAVVSGRRTAILASRAAFPSPGPRTARSSNVRQGPHCPRRDGGRPWPRRGRCRSGTGAGAPSRHRIPAVRRFRAHRAAARCAGRSSNPRRALVHTDIAVRMEDKPSQALRYGRWKSSMWLAIDAVKKGDADMVVSGGNTGALMAMSKFNLKTLPGIERPAIAALWPTVRGEFDRARRRCLDWSGCRPSCRSCRDGRRDRAHSVRPRPADCGTSQYRGRGGQGSRTGPGSQPLPPRRQSARSRLSGLCRRRRYRPRQGRRRGHRGFCRQHRAQGGRGHRAANR